MTLHFKGFNHHSNSRENLKSRKQWPWHSGTVITPKKRLMESSFAFTRRVPTRRMECCLVTSRILRSPDRCLLWNHVHVRPWLWIKTNWNKIQTKPKCRWPCAEFSITSFRRMGVLYLGTSWPWVASFTPLPNYPCYPFVSRKVGGGGVAAVLSTLWRREHSYH